MKKMELNYLGEDFLGMPVYKDPDGVHLKDINCGHGELALHTISGDDTDGDPNVSITNLKKYRGVKFVILGREDEPTHGEKLDYQLLGRLKMDCEYFLGYGNRHEKHLWAGNVADQIQKMKELHNKFSADKKPEWLTHDDILSYERQMTA